MKKRVFSMLLALVMALSLLPTMAVAEGAWGQDNYFELQYNDCNHDGSSHASITVDNEAKNSGFYSFAQGQTMQFVLTPDSTMPAEEIDPFVEIEVFDASVSGAPNARYESRRETTDESNHCYPLPLNKTESTYSFSFTPTSNKFFSVRVYWSDRDRYETFGFNESDEIQLQYRVLGNADVNFTFKDNDRGRVNYHNNGDGYQYCKQNITKETTSIGVTLSARDGFVFDSAEFCKDGENPVSITVTDNQFTWNSDYFDWELKVVFVDPNNPGGNGGPQGGPRTTDWAALKSEIEGYTFAYGPASGATADETMLKKGIAAELYARKMGNGPDSSDTTLGMALGYDPEHADSEAMTTNETAIAAMITITGEKQTAKAPVNLPFYEFTVNTGTSEDAPDINAETEGIQPFTARGKVYVLQKDNDFILKTTKTTEGVSTTEYKIVSYAGSKNGKSEGQEGNEEADRFVYAPFDVDDRGEPAIEAYGNGIFLNNAISEDGSVFGFHAACEHCGSIGNINCRLIVSSAKNSIQISSTDDAAAWNFINVGVYAAEGTKEEPVNATIFFGSETISFSKATGDEEVTNVEAADLPSGAVSFNSETKVLTFNTNYDEVLVKITYNDNSFGYMILNRVGLTIDGIQIDKKADVQNGDRFSPEEKTACAGDSFNVWHGTDQSVRYKSSADKVIVGSFYYDCNYYVEHDNQNKWHVYIGNSQFVEDSIVNGNSAGFDSKQAAVNALHTAVGSVQLLVTITDNNNNVTRKLVSDPLSGAKAVNNGGFNDDADNAVGYAGQGSNHVYDDFLLWSGSEAEYANIKSVSAIVYNAGNDDTFGGVKVGSGTGVLWENN